MSTTLHATRDLEPLVVAFERHFRLWQITRQPNQRRAARQVARRIHRLERKWGAR